MPSPGEDIQSWSTVAANNGASDPLIDWHEGQARASVNNSARGMMAAHAKNRNLLNGSIVTTGTVNAQQFLSGLTYTTIPTGLVVKLKIGAGLTNTASATLNMDGLGDTLIVDTAGANLKGGELVAGCYTDFLYNGTNWVFLYSQQFLIDLINGGGGVIIGKQVFAAAGTFTYTPTPGTECAFIDCIGGGGGGGGTPNSAASNGHGGGGGGAGGYSRAIKTATEIGGSQTITVGAKGTGGVTGGSVAGLSGGDTTFGALCVAKGGTGGQGSIGVNTLGGAGGIAGIGDITGVGESGEPGLAHIQVLSAMSGRGGSTAFGSGGASIITTSAVNGTHATGAGGGGGGGASFGGAGATQGGNGSDGLVIITEFAGRGAPGRDGVDGATGPIGPAGPSGPGTGDVLRSGTPAAGQFAMWTDASHIQGVSPAAIAAFTNIVVQTFTASGTYTPTSNMKFAIVECIGGGGGGGVGYGSVAGAMYMIGGGGGSGGYSRKRVTAADIGASKAVTIGAGGAGGTPATPYNGSNGGDTSVGTLCIAKGGLGGQFTANTPTQNGLGGAGGVAGTGDIVAAGAPGDGGFYNVLNNAIGCRSGLGGSSVMGGGAAATNAGNGFNATNYGSGGSGGTSADGISYRGGNGSAGFVIITEYI